MENVLADKEVKNEKYDYNGSNILIVLNFIKYKGLSREEKIKVIKNVMESESTSFDYIFHAGMTNSPTMDFLSPRVNLKDIWS